MRRAALTVLACAPASVLAHTFGQPYTLPVPLWLYAWAATAVLVLSFFVAAYFLTESAAAPARVPAASRPRPNWLAFARRLHLGTAGRGLALAWLLAVIVTGLAGSGNPQRNLSMNAFWILFVLGFTYLTAVAGNVYAVLNPWRVLTGLIGKVWASYERGRWRYPERLGDWPALILYAGFIAFELLAWVTPSSLGATVAGYTLLNLVAVWAVGADAWFRHGEFFSLLLRLVGLLAPIDVRQDGSSVQVASRFPGAGVLHERPTSWAVVIFVLCMLASTAFDGLQATRAWATLFWHDPTGLVSALAGARPLEAVPALRSWYPVWQAAGLVLTPCVYLLLYVGALALGRRLAGSRRNVRELACDFAYTLLPIVLAYHASHYATLLVGEGHKILSLVSDPFGWHWDLFGTRERYRATYIPDLTATWHAQVGVIVVGHVASIVLAHRVALQVFPGRMRALASQFPMLALMALYTVAGLWLLAQPLQATLVR